MNQTTEDKIEEVPPVLYKYRDFSEAAREYVRQAVVENKVWFSSGSNFNDPFDCKVRVSFKGSVRELKRHMLRQHKAYIPGLNRQQRQAENARIFREEKRHEDPELYAKITADAQKEYDKWGIYCLSAANDILLMWSYYANGHRGLCLGFAHPAVEQLGPAAPVIYSAEYPQVDYLTSDYMDKFRAIFLTKALAWKHEREWRIIDRSHGRGVRYFSPDLLVEVILGAQMAKEDRKEVISWIEARSCRPSLFEARLRTGVYGLDIHLIAPGTLR